MRDATFTRPLGQPTGAQSAGQYQNQGESSDLGALQIIANKLDELMKFADHQGITVESIDTRLTGGAPEKHPGGPAAVPAGLVGLLNQKIDAIGTRLKQTQESVSRINSAV